MAKAPWLRFTKRISPRVTDSPTAITNSTMPYASPSMRMLESVFTWPRASLAQAEVQLRPEAQRLRIDQRPSLPLHLAQVDVLRDVARLAVDAHGPARALPLQFARSRQRLGAVPGPAGRLDHSVDPIPAVLGHHRGVVRQ